MNAPFISLNPKVLTLGQQEGNESQDVSRLMSKAVLDFVFKTPMAVLFVPSDEFHKTP